MLEEKDLPFPLPLFDVKGDFVAGNIGRASTTVGGESTSLQGSYPTILMEQGNQEEKP